MAASINDKLIKQGNGTQPIPTQLTAEKAISATTASLASATGWDTTTGKHVRMYKTKVVSGQTVPDQSTLSFYKATLSGTTLSDLTLVWSATGSDQKYDAGDTVDLSYTSGWGDDLYSALSTHLDQDGTLKAGAVDNAAVVASGILTADRNVPSANIETFRSEALSDFIASGGTVAQSAGLVGTFSNIVYYIAGVRYTATSIANKTYTASKDTYVDINTSGTVTYVEVANGATVGMTLTANSVRVAKVVTNGSAITSVTQVGADSLGNLIYPYSTQKNMVIRQDGAATVINTAKQKSITIAGWGFITGTGAAFASKTVTFPVTFTSAPVLTISCAGYKDSSDPTAISDVTGNWEVPNLSGGAITTTQFGASFITSDGSTVASSRRVMFAWIAVGEVA